MSSAFVFAVLVVAVSAAVRGVWSPCGLSMVSAINPMSERARGNRYALTAGWFLAGSLIGGALLGAFAAALAVGVRAANPPAGLLAAGAAVGCVLAVADDLRLLPVRLPRLPRQVNERWMTDYRRWVYATGFGLQIGVGLATYVMTATVYMVPLLGALSGSPTLALAGGLVFGAGRGLAVLLTARVREPSDLLALHRFLDREQHWSTVQVTIVAGAASMALAWSAAASVAGPADSIGMVGGPLAGAVAAALAVAVTAGLARAGGSRQGDRGPGSGTIGVRRLTGRLLRSAGRPGTGSSPRPPTGPGR